MKPIESRADPCSAFKHAEYFLPKDTGKFGTNPSFRMMHDFIKHDFIVRILECWSTEVEGDVGTSSSATTLQDWGAKQGPSFDYIVEVALKIVEKYVARGVLKREVDPARQDASFENTQLLLRDYLLYDETHYAMNHGDVARFETCIVDWIYIWRTTGKHAYAKQMSRFPLEVHFMYPAGLR